MYLKSRQVIPPRQIQVGVFVISQVGVFVIYTGEVITTYTLDVADIDSYFVSSAQVLVHNCNETSAAGDVTKQGGRKGASGELTTTSGNTFTGNSTRSSRTGGDLRAPMNGQVSNALDNVKNPSGTHGACCEIDAMNKAANAGETLRDARMGPVRDNKTGEIKPPCSTCRDVMDQLGVDH